MTAQDDPDATWGTVNGWKNSSWPLGYTLDRDKICTRPAPFD